MVGDSWFELQLILGGQVVVLVEFVMVVILNVECNWSKFIGGKLDVVFGVVCFKRMFDYYCVVVIVISDVVVNGLVVFRLIFLSCLIFGIMFCYLVGMFLLLL